MLLRSGWIASCVLLLLVDLLAPSRLYAQEQRLSGVIPVRVVSAVASSSGQGVLLQLQGKQPLPVPVIQYFPGENGKTIMAIDFAGMVWNQPSSIIRPANAEVEMVRIGQFQSNPPVFRISITTSNPSLLRKIDLGVKGELLTLKLPAAGRTASSPIVTSGQPPRSGLFAAGPEAAPKRDVAAAGLTPTRAAVEKLTAPFQSTGEIPTLRPAIAQGGLPAEPTSRESAATPLAEAAPVLPLAPLVDAKPKRNPFAYLSAVLPPLAPSFRRKRPAKSVALPDESASSPPNLSGSSLAPGEKNAAAAERTALAAPARQESKNPPLAPDFHQAPAGAAAKRASVKTATLPGERSPGSLPWLNAERDGGQSSLAGGQEQKQAQGAPSSSSSPALSFSGSQPLQLAVRGSSAMKYRSFRLFDPERYVIDFSEGAPSIDMVLPQSPVPSILAAVRTGMPDSENGGVRLVLDLGRAGLSIKESLSGDRNCLLLTLAPAPESVPGGSQATVVLDAGHGGSDPGAQRGDLREKDMTMGITLKLKKNLEQRGLRVILTRADDAFVSLEERVRITNEVKPDAFVSVHINSLESDSDISGIETYYQNDTSKVLADKIHESLVSQLAVPNRSVRKARFYVVNHTPHPAILAEVGFISNKQEREKLMSSQYQGKVADALEQGIISYLSATRNTVFKHVDKREAADLTSGPEKVRSEAANMSAHIFTR